MDTAHRILAALLSVAVALLVSMTIEVSSWPTLHQVGYTYERIEKMREVCEKELPRNKHCYIQIEFVEGESK